jgi:hypothetical protein
MEQVVLLPGKLQSKDPKLTNHSINNLERRLGERKPRIPPCMGIGHHRRQVKPVSLALFGQHRHHKSLSMVQQSNRTLHSQSGKGQEDKAPPRNSCENHRHHKPLGYLEGASSLGIV